MRELEGQYLGKKEKMRDREEQNIGGTGMGMVQKEDRRKKNRNGWRTDEGKTGEERVSRENKGNVLRENTRGCAARLNLMRDAITT